MNKKAQGDLSPLLVSLVVLVVSLGVLLLVYIEWGDVLEEESLKKNCQWNLLLSAFTKSPVLGIETIPPDCKMTRKNITLEQLEDKKRSNKKEIDEFNKKYKDSKYVSFHSNSEEELLEFEMNRVIANEIKDCWDVAWMGQMPIFQEWWNLIECEPDKEGDFKCGCPENKECSLPEEVSSRLRFWNYEASGPPAFCLLCSRIKFDEGVKEKFNDKIITSLPEWMQKHPVLIDALRRSYYEYTKDDVNRGIFAPEYLYEVDEPLAIVYARVNVYKPLQYAETLVRWTGVIMGGYNKLMSSERKHKSINVLSLIPYSEVSKKCTYIIG